MVWTSDGSRTSFCVVLEVRCAFGAPATECIAPVRGSVPGAVGLRTFGRAPVEDSARLGLVRNGAVGARLKLGAGRDIRPVVICESEEQ